MGSMAAVYSPMRNITDSQSGKLSHKRFRKPSAFYFRFGCAAKAFAEFADELDTKRERKTRRKPANTQTTAGALAVKRRISL